MIIRSTFLFTKRNGKLYPKRDVRIGGITIYKGDGVPKGGIAYLDYIQDHWKSFLEVTLDNSIFVITGMY